MARPTKHQKRYKNVGRKPLLTKDIISKLEEVAAYDASVEEMAYYIGVARSTLYRWLDENPELKDRLDALRNKPILKARETVIKGIEGNPQFALTYLERKRKSEFSPKTITEHTGEIKHTAEVTPKQREIADKYDEELRQSYLEGPKAQELPASV